MIPTICKYIGQLLAVLLFSITVYSQTEEDNQYLTDLDRYNVDIVQPEFSIRFKGDEKEKNNFKKLREFLKEKTSLLDILENELEDHTADTFEIESIQKKIARINVLIAGKKPGDTVSVQPDLLGEVPFLSLRKRDTLYNKIQMKSVAELIEKIADYKTDIENIRKELKTIRTLKKNIRNVQEDITQCTNQIDSALAPEYQQQDFRKKISIYFTLLIGLLVSVFFFIVYKRSDHTLSKDLLSGNGLQFITLFVLIIAVILFGILSILQSSELAAILSGISGYILGKGTQKDLSAMLNTGGTLPTNTPPSSPPPQNQPTGNTGSGNTP